MRPELGTSKPDKRLNLSICNIQAVPRSRRVSKGLKLSGHYFWDLLRSWRCRKPFVLASSFRRGHWRAGKMFWRKAPKGASPQTMWYVFFGSRGSMTEPKRDSWLSWCWMTWPLETLTFGTDRTFDPTDGSHSTLYSNQTTCVFIWPCPNLYFQISAGVTTIIPSRLINLMNPVSYAARLYSSEPQCYSRDTMLQGVLWACAN